jgi:hypothetical protein
MDWAMAVRQYLALTLRECYKKGLLCGANESMSRGQVVSDESPEE